MSTDISVMPYQQLRAATLARDRGLRDKVMSLEEAAKLVQDGEHVGIGGCHTSRTPFAMIWALIRARKKDLVFSRSITSTEGDLLFASGISAHAITSWFTQGIVWGVSKVMRHYTENKLARFEEYSGRLRSLVAEEGCDPGKFKTVLYYGVSVNDDRDRAFHEAKAFLDSYYQKDFTREGVEIWTACGPAQHCIEQIRGFVKAGVDHITIRPIGADLNEQFRIFLEEILPALRTA